MATYAAYGLAGVDGTLADDMKLVGYFVCGVGRGHFAVTNTAWPELMGPWLRTRSSRSILVVVYVGGNLR